MLLTNKYQQNMKTRVTKTLKHGIVVFIYKFFSYRVFVLYLVGNLFQKGLPLKYSVCVPYRQVFVARNFNG